MAEQRYKGRSNTGWANNGSHRSSYAKKHGANRSPRTKKQPPNNINPKKSQYISYKDQKERQTAIMQIYADMAKKINNTAGVLYQELDNPTVPTYTTYTKGDYRDYVENPSRNESRLREMSQFLSRVSMPYKRMLWYFAEIYCWYWHLSPKLNQFDLPEEDDLFQKYSEMCFNIEKLGLSEQMVNIIYFALRDGVFYGYLYESDNSIIIHRLNPDYCRAVQLDDYNTFNFAFDFNYFQRYTEALEGWSSDFASMYEAYQKDRTNMRWQMLDPQKSICIKADPNLEYNVPFFLGMFEALLDLIDARTLQRNKDIIQNYKLIVQKIPLFGEDNSKELDDFRIQANTVTEFADLLADSVPEQVGVATTPMDIDTVDFKTDDNSNDLITSSMRQVFDDAGVSKLLFNSSTTGSTGVSLSVTVDAGISWKIVKFIEAWIKRFISYRVSSIDFDFEVLDVNIFNKKEAVDRELSLANSGVPNKMKLAATAGLSPGDTISNEIFENHFLKIHENWMPLQTSYTMSSNDSGRPESDEGENDSTDANKDNVENQG